MAQLTEQQKYLLNRLPNRYDFKTTAKPEPETVKRARKTIEDFTSKIDKAEYERKKKYNKALVAAREAIHFRPAGDALAIVKALELEFPEIAK